MSAANAQWRRLTLKYRRTAVLLREQQVIIRRRWHLAGASLCIPILYPGLGLDFTPCTYTRDFLFLTCLSFLFFIRFCSFVARALL